MNAYTFEFFEMADAICKRPKMYTANGTFGEVIALLEGYALGAIIFRNRGHHSLDPFQRFLSKQGIFESVGDFVGWNSFYDAYQDDETALKELRRLLKEFRGKVYEIEEIGIDIWIEESEAGQIFFVLSSLEFAEENHPAESAVLNLRETIERQLSLLPLQKKLRWKIDREEDEEENL